MSVKELSSLLSANEAMLVTSPENRFYLTHFPSSDGYLFVTRDRSVFLTDSRYIEAAQKEVTQCDETQLLFSVSMQLSELAERFGITKIYTESDRLSVSEYIRFKEIFSCEVCAEKNDEMINSLRRKKSEKEVSLILEAQAIAERAFEHILGFIKEGVTEKEIALELDNFMILNGAQALSFETIAVSGKNSSMPHGVPSKKRIEKGDFITLDFGAVVGGYHSDMTRTVALGSVSENQIRVYETVLEAQLSSLKAIGEGVSCFEADAAARRVIEAAGYGDCFGHGTGHGVGVEIHEQPRLSKNSDQILQRGDVVTVEPGIYLPGKFGVRIEDMVYIGENGVRNLTNSPKNLIIL